MPKPQDKSASVAKANSPDPDQASNHSTQRVINSKCGDVISAINELKTDLKGDNENLRHKINHLGQEINGKLNNIVVEMQSLSERVSETETRVEQVESWVAEATEALCTCLEQQRVLQHKLTDLKSRSRRNNIRIFGVAEEEEGNSVQ
ncbi:hypothetical protein ABVT39_005588 [Epinephelus coioides]